MATGFDRFWALDCLFASVSRCAKISENPGFETGKIGESPEGWLNGGGFAGYPAELTDQSPERGRLCGLLYTDPTSKVRDYGVLSQMVDVTAFRNKAISLRTFARVVTAPNSWAAFAIVSIERASRSLFT